MKFNFKQQRNIMKTFLLKQDDVHRIWYIIDMKGKNFGREMTTISKLLMGKSKVNYTPNIDNGDYVILLNASQFVVTGNKMNKYYYRHSQYPSGLKKHTMRGLLTNNPTTMIQKSILGMLPKNILRLRMIKRLKIYLNSNHKHYFQYNKSNIKQNKIVTI